MSPAVFPPIICEVCKKPVGNTLVRFDKKSYSYVFTVQCHGKLDTKTIPADAFDNGWIVEARAFGPPEVIDTEEVKKPLCLTFVPDTELNDPLPEIEAEVIVDPGMWHPPQMETQVSGITDLFDKEVEITSVIQPPADKFDREVNEWAGLICEAL